MMKKRVLGVIIVVSLITFASVTTVAQADQFPDGQITLIVPFKAGGATDIIMRVLDKYAPEAFGQRFEFKYIPGAGGRQGVKTLADSPSDGYTIAGYNFPTIVAESILGVGGYKLDDFSFICRTVADPHALVTRNGSKYKSLSEFVEAAKANPGKLTVSIPSKFDGTEIALYNLEDKLGIKVTVVPFLGGARQKAGVLGGHVDAGMVNFSNVSTIVDELNVLGITTDKPLPGLKNVETFRQQGANVVSYEQRIVLAPSGVDRSRLKTLRDGCKAIYDKPGFKADMAKLHQPLSYMSGSDLEKYMRGRLPTYKKLVNKYLAQ